MADIKHSTSELRSEAKLRLQISVGHGYSFMSEVSANSLVEDFIRQIEREMTFLFSLSSPIRILGVRDSNHNDISPNYRVGSVFHHEELVLPLRDLVHVSEQEERVDLLILHPKNKPSASRGGSRQKPSRCQPYCRTLAPFGQCEHLCPSCGEVKAYMPIRGSQCTALCRTGDTRKVKSQGLQFCSICLSRYRHRKYAQGVVHQCRVCHRPWLILNKVGVCRTCHCEQKRTAGHVPFRPDPPKVGGELLLDRSE